MKNLKFLSMALLAATFTFTSCNNDDDNPEEIHDHDAIEEVVIEVKDADGNEVGDFEYEHEQESGTPITLNANTLYNFEVVGLLPEHEEGEEDHDHDDEHNLIHEVEEEKEEHFFVFMKENGLDITSLTRTDEAETTREDGTKLGVKFQIETGAASSGDFQLVLKHEPTTVDDAANDNYGSSTGGETDVEAVYTITIQ